jgi:ataxia telangiectasia mutated family protein
VPFRLTRDVVDGMGPSGTDGVFSASGQATMSVMRSNADTLLTILSAVVSDPLYKWSLSPLMANQRQRNDDESRLDFLKTRMSSASDESRNDAADRAIAKIHEKLQGYEDGTSGEHKTIAGQVKMLINEARDRDKLCVMFAGWAPWM